MSWKTPFIVYRMTQDNKLEEIFWAEDLNKAKYWLTYIAQLGDVLTRTPAHPKNTSGLPEYWSHKEQSGKTVTDKEKWLKMYSFSDFQSQFPHEEAAKNDA